jgi:hypothetical protein
MVPTANGYVVEDPLSSVIEGMLQGHQLAASLHRQALEDQAFKTNQILQNQKISADEIMRQMQEQEHSLPVENGTVRERLNPVQGQPGPLTGVVPGVGNGPGIEPQTIVRKADSSRTYTRTDPWGNKITREILTPEQQTQRATQLQIGSQNALQEASAQNQMKIAQEQRANQLKLQGGGVQAQGLASLGIPDGTPLTWQEAAEFKQKAAQIRKEGFEKLGPGDTLLDTAPGAAGEGQKPPVVATGGPPLPTDDFGKYFRPAYAKSLGKKPEDLTPEEEFQALSQFKSVNQDPDLKAAHLAAANTMNLLHQLQLQQQPTQEQARQAAEDIVNHRLAPEQMATMFGGFGTSGQALKRMVYAEAKKMDPNFNFEQASSDYTYGKSPALQNTVRLMDSALNSIPRMQQAANTLAQGNVRSINTLIKLGKNQFNNVDLKRFQTDATLVGDEIGKIIQGGGTGSGVSDAKLTQAQALLKDTDSPKAIATALEEVNAIIGYRRQAVTRGTYLEGRQGPPAEAAAGTIRVKRKADGVTGSIDAKDFDPAKYEKVQ